MSNIIDVIEKEGMRNDIPDFRVGDTVKVFVKVIEKTVEGNKEKVRERLQAYEGLVIARKNGGIGETFTVRRMSFGVGVERTFPLHSPKIDHIEVIRSGKVRRAKLYYMRDRIGKAARLKEVVRKKDSVQSESQVKEKAKKATKKEVEKPVENKVESAEKSE